MLQTIEIFFKLTLDGFGLKFLMKLFPATVTVFLLWYCLKLEFFFCLISGVATTFFYNHLYFYILKKCPKSFTLGEVSIVIQGYTLFIYNCVLLLPSISEPANLNQTLNIILQVNYRFILKSFPSKLDSNLLNFHFFRLVCWQFQCSY